MKRIKKHIISILITILSIILTRNIYAATANISASKTSAYVGDSVTINVNINAAAWNLNVSGSGINGGTITGFNMEGVNQSTSKSYTLNTSSVGTYVISLKGDVSDGSTEITSDISRSVTVIVSPKPVVTTPAPTPTTPPANTNTNTSNKVNNSNTSKPQSNNSNKNTGTTQVLSSNAYLSEFRLGEPGITPSFDKRIYNYSLAISGDVQSLEVIAIPEDNNATVDISGNTDLKIGDNIVTVRVTAQDKKTTNTYTVTVTKSDNPEKSNAYLQSLFVENLTLVPEFSSEIFEYDLGKIDADVNTLKISAFPINENAEVEIIGNENMVVGENTIKVVVTSENGEVEKTYNLKVFKEYNEKNSLVDIENTRTGSDVWNALKENATVLLLYLFVWVEFIQVVYLYERLKKAENVDLISKNKIHEEPYIDKVKGIIRRTKIWKRD